MSLSLKMDYGLFFKNSLKTLNLFKYRANLFEYYKKKNILTENDLNLSK